jgi:hypothetical protein
VTVRARHSEEALATLSDPFKTALNPRVDTDTVAFRSDALVPGLPRHGAHPAVSMAGRSAAWLPARTQKATPPRSSQSGHRPKLLDSNDMEGS